MVIGMNHTGFVVKDLDKSVDFYRKVVGLNPNPPKEGVGLAS